MGGLFCTMRDPYPYWHDVALDNPTENSAEYISEPETLPVKSRQSRVLPPQVNLCLKELGLPPQHQKSTLQSLFTLAPLHQESLLRLLKELQPEHRHSLMKLLEGLELWHQQSLLKLLEGLELQHQQSLLRLLEELQPQHQPSLLRLFERLQPLYQQSLLRVLERLHPQHLIQQSLLRLLEGLELWHQCSLLRLLEELQPQHQQTLLQCLEGEKAEYRQACLSRFEQLERVYRYNFMSKVEQPIESLLRILGWLKSQKQQNLLRALRGLEPLEQEKLLRQLEGPESIEQVKTLLRVLGGLSEPLEQAKLLRLLVLECEEQKLLNLLEKLKQLGQLRLLEGLEPEDQSEVLRLVEQLDALGRLKQLKGLELLPAESKMIKLKKSLKLLGILETAKPPKKVIIMRQLKMELARLEKQEELRQERLKRLLEEYKHLLQQLVEWLMVYLSEVGGRGGGLTHLLLDAWWLEFWELVLLAAGDVERNPGPIADEQLAKIDNRPLRKDSDLSDVYKAVYDCRAKWYNLCLALRVSDDDLSAIQREHRDIATCLRGGISLWLQRVHSYGPPTWRVLVDAIANSSGGDNHVLALDIADKHQAITTAASSHHTRADHKESVEMSSAFSRMYRFIVQHLQVDVGEVRASLRFLTDPRHPDQLCVPPSVYEDVTTTKELLTLLCPRYVNPVNTFVLEEIVRECGTQKCKRRLRKYIDKYMQ